MANEPKLEGTITLSGLLETIRDLKELGKAGKKALADVREAVKAVEPAVKKLSTDIGNLRGALGEIRTNGAAAGRTMAAGFMTAAAAARATATATASIVTAAGKAKAAVSSIGSGATKVGAVGAAGIGGAGLLAKSGDDYYRKIEEVSRGTGVSINRIAVLQEAYKKAGYDISDINGAFVQLNTVVKDAMGGNEDAIRFFGAIGVSEQQVRSITSIDDVLPNIINALNGMPDGLVKTNLAAYFFGEDDGSRFLAATRGGTAALGQLQEQMRSAGLLFDSTNATWLRAVSENFSRLWMLIRGVAIEVAVKLAPAIYNLITLFGRLLQDNRARIVDSIARAANVLLVVFRDLYYIMVGRPDLVQNGWLLQIVPAFRTLIASGRELAAQIPGIVASLKAIAEAGVAEALIRGGQVINELVLKYREFEAWLVPTIAMLEKQFEDMSKKFWTLWTTQLKPVWDGIHDAIRFVLRTVGDMTGLSEAQVAFGLFLLRFLGVFSILGTVIGTVASAFRAVYFAVMLVWPVLTGLVGMFGGLWTWIARIGVAILAFVGWPAMIAAAVGVALGLLIGWIASHWTEVKGFFSGIFDYVGQKWDDMWSWLGEVWDEMVSGVRANWAAFTGWLSGIWGGITGFFGGIVDSVWSALDGMWQGVVNAFSNILNFALGIWGRIKNAVLDAVSAVGQFFGMGGSAVSAMNGMQMPMAAVPAYAMPSVASAGGGGGTPINLNLGGGSYQTSASTDVADALRAYGRQTGRLTPVRQPRW